MLKTKMTSAIAQLMLSKIVKMSLRGVNMDPRATRRITKTPTRTIVVVFR